MTPGSHLLSALSLGFITLNLLVWIVPLVLLGFVKFVVPPIARSVDPLMDGIYRIAVRLDDFWLKRVLGIEWPHPVSGLQRSSSALVISNHVSWSDILLIQSVLVPHGPLVKFLAKRELVWVPIFGVIFWAFDFPMLRRRTRPGEDEQERRARDQAALVSACEVLRDRPAALVNFAEGTRFDEAKRIDSQSPFEHLLDPRVGGLHTLREAVGDQVETVIDLTLIYPRESSFWEFLSGAVDKVEVEAELIPTSSLPATREALREWLSARWALKDSRIAVRRQAIEAGSHPVT